MSDDGFSDTFDESSIEIQVKSLMGTTFDIKVSFNDTIGAIKKKIYRVGGKNAVRGQLINVLFIAKGRLHRRILT